MCDVRASHLQRLHSEDAFRSDESEQLKRELLCFRLCPVLRLLILGLQLLYDSLRVIVVNHLLQFSLLISLCLLSLLTQLQPGDSDLRHCTD